MGVNLFHRRGPPERSDPVASPERSQAALATVPRHPDDAGNTVHSFATLLDELGTLTRNTIVFSSSARVTKLATRPSSSVVRSS